MDNSKIEAIIEHIMALARGDFDYQSQISEEKDDLDAVILGLNLLGEDLKDTTVSMLTYRSEKEKLELAAKAAGFGTYVLDFEAGDISWSPEMKAIFGLKADEPLPIDEENLFMALHPDDRHAFKAAIKAASEPRRGGQLLLDFRIYWPDGTLRWLRIGGRAEFKVEGGVARPVRVIGAVVDITGSKRLEEALRLSLQENQVLLHELKHRAKNTFNMICGMIHMASKGTDSAETKELLDELNSRVMAIAEIYSILGSSSTFAEVSLNDYCLRIAGPIVSLAGGRTLSTDMDSIVASVDLAAPIGMIVNELVTNAIKYAFRGAAGGCIALTLKRKSGSALMGLCDDGVGLPAGFDLSTSSGLGLRLVRELVTQIGGSFRIERGAPGTNCFVEFPLPTRESESLHG